MIRLKYIATLGFIGYLPFAPGTFGTLAAVFFMVALKPSVLVHIELTVFFIIAGILSSNHAVKFFEDRPKFSPFGTKKISGEKDPSCIVIDEFAGYMASLLFLPLSQGYIIVAFILFRFFDILKPPPLRKLEDIFNGGFGIMADDIGAAVYTNLVLQLWKLLN
ncbi:MAG TPA: phosphatidylglycerophosphatase A [Deltaproteobacteria bacterium]|nr:phosphatidylglycerophosphatase A [Deltaproteobacteria bacterium]